MLCKYSMLKPTNPFLYNSENNECYKPTSSNILNSNRNSKFLYFIERNFKIFNRDLFSFPCD